MRKSRPLNAPTRSRRRQCMTIVNRNTYLATWLHVGSVWVILVANRGADGRSTIDQNFKSKETARSPLYPFFSASALRALSRPEDVGASERARCLPPPWRCRL